MTRAIAVSATLALLAVSPALAGPARSAKTRDRLVARVDAFWKAWEAHNQHQIFLLYAPSYRKGTSELAFLQLTQGMLGITPVSYTLGPVELSADGTKATVTLDAQTVIAPFGQVPNKLVQHWTYEEGDWYRVMDPPSIPVMPPPAITSPGELAGPASPPPSAPSPLAPSSPVPSATPSPSPRP